MTKTDFLNNFVLLYEQMTFRIYEPVSAVQAAAIYRWWQVDSLKKDSK